MKKVTIKIISFFAIFFIIVNLLQPSKVFSETNDSNKGQLSASETLRKYIELRLSDADWEEYSQYITWPDEPAWDCKWVVSKYNIGPSKQRKGKITIPVAYIRLGLYCVGDEDFNPVSKKITINYKLVENKGRWKINSEIYDYPEISVETVMKQLETSAKEETQERRIQIESIISKIKKIKN